MIPLTAEHRALADSIAAFAADARAIETVREQADGSGLAWQKHWAGLAELGVLGVAVPEWRDGGGGGLLDAAVVAESCAASLVPGPVLPTLLGSMLLGDHPACAELADGRAHCAIAHGLRVEDGLLSGTAVAIGGADGARLIAGTDAGWFLVDTAQVALESCRTLDPSAPLATVSLDRVPGEALTPAADPSTLTDVLVAAECAGVVGWCLRTATAYAATREQFGRPIGSFQAVKLLCTDLLCANESTVALAWDAAGCAERLPAAAARAAGIEHAVAAAKQCVQVLGGIGFTWEHDAHLYLRRALALRALFGSGADERVARLALDGHRGSSTLTGEVAQGARDELDSAVAAVSELDDPADRRHELADRGLLAPHYPRPYGLDADPALQLAVDDALARAGIERPDLVVGGWALPTILAHGTDSQRERFVRPTLRGELTWCQLFSEPEAGSDLAGLRTSAEPVAGGWRLRGQKVWTSLAAEADWAICLARTDQEAPKHRGITYFLVDMRTPGITVRPLREITGESLFNEVFLDEVFVPDDCVVGSVDQGWRVARATLANERVALSANASFGDDLERLLGRVGRDADAQVLGTVGELVCSALTVRALDTRATSAALAGRAPGAESAVRKLVGVAHRQRAADRALWLEGENGAILTEDTEPQSTELLRSRALSIAGGSTQVLAVHAAERVLGLPREQ